jgi:hypothetical protein
MKLQYNKLISMGALIALAGYMLSGPIAFLIVNFVRPQPVWVSPSVFVDNYHFIQGLPYYFGFLLIGGMLMVVGGHQLNYRSSDAVTKFHLLLSFAWTIIFAVLIAFNYICQTTFVHNLALHYRPEYDAAIAMFSMSNPLSFCWANEMWGYGFLGIATLLLSGYYQIKSKAIYRLLIANGIVSLLSVAWMIADISWVMKPIGLVAYFSWNVLMITLMILIYRYSKSEIRELKASAESLTFSHPRHANL